MNIAIIFAGGIGSRMQTASRPKQFLELNGKPIIIYTIEVFEHHPEIDAIIISCIKEWIPHLHKLLKKFDINKVVDIVPGGNNGQESIYNGIAQAEKISKGQDSIVLIHDGVRPLITEQTITDNIETVKKHGACVTVSPAFESIIIEHENGDIETPNRKCCFLARAPQSFYLADIIDAHRKAKSEGKTEFADSSSLMRYYGYNLKSVIGPIENIKITTPSDFFVLKAMVEVNENKQIFGI